MGTAHNNAPEGAFAKTVLMPGDPLRAKFIAETFLEDAVLVNNVRGVQGYTGTYKGVRVSVMASGMGCPSMGIYSHELFHFFGVENILRIGSAGAMTEKLQLQDIVMAQGVCSDSNYAHQFGLNGSFAAIANYELLETAVAVAREKGVQPNVGNVFASDTFYNKSYSPMKWGEMGILATEMESYALYCNAAEAGKRALAICTISDSLVTGEQLSAEDRQLSFRNMMEIALEVAVRMDAK